MKARKPKNTAVQRLLTAARPGKPFYVVLGVPPNASEDQIRRQWRSIAAAHHPDQNGGITSDLYRKCERAAAVLSDPARRKFYDQTGIDPLDNQKSREKEATGAIRSTISAVMEDYRPGLNVLEAIRCSLRRGVESREIDIRRLERTIVDQTAVLAELEASWKGEGMARAIAVEILSERIKELKASRESFVGSIEAGRAALAMIDSEGWEMPAPAFPDLGGSRAASQAVWLGRGHFGRTL